MFIICSSDDDTCCVAIAKYRARCWLEDDSISEASIVATTDRSMFFDGPIIMFYVYVDCNALNRFGSSTYHITAKIYLVSINRLKLCMQLYAETCLRSPESALDLCFRPP